MKTWRNEHFFKSMNQLQNQWMIDLMNGLTKAEQCVDQGPLHDDVRVGFDQLQNKINSDQIKFIWNTMRSIAFCKYYYILHCKKNYPWLFICRISGHPEFRQMKPDTGYKKRKGHISCRSVYDIASCKSMILRSRAPLEMTLSWSKYSL